MVKLFELVSGVGLGLLTSFSFDAPFYTANSFTIAPVDDEALVVAIAARAVVDRVFTLPATFVFSSVGESVATHECRCVAFCSPG